MSIKSNTINWRAVQLVVVMLLLLGYSAIEFSTRNVAAGKQSGTEKSIASIESQTALSVFARD